MVRETGLFGGLLLHDPKTLCSTLALPSLRRIMTLVFVEGKHLVAQFCPYLTFVGGYGKLNCSAPVAQRIERWPPEPEARVRVTAGVLSKVSSDRRYSRKSLSNKGEAFGVILADSGG